MMDAAQEDIEWHLREDLRKATEAYRALLEKINDRSMAAKIDVAAFDAFVHDECPDALAWDEKVNNLAYDARRAHGART